MQNEIKKMPFFWIFVAIFVIAMIIQGIMMIQKSREMSNTWNEFLERDEKYMNAVVNETNTTSKIVTWEITRGGPLDIEEITWTLNLEGTETEVEMKAIKKTQEEFTDDDLVEDDQYQIYWKDTSYDNFIGIGDYLKVKAPHHGRYFLYGEFEGWRIFSHGTSQYY